MKINDDSYKSITILENKISKHLSKEVWVPDWGVLFPESAEQTEYDVILMGSYFERIFQSRYWPKNDFNLYCLCEKTKKVLSELSFFENEVIGLISRYSLFPKCSSIKTFDLNPGTNFCHSGKISPRKNIDFLIMFIFYLQVNYSEQISLSLFGDFDSSYHKDILGVNFVNYKNKINHLINSLPWPGEKPLIVPGLSEEEWLDHMKENSILLSTSNYISEDFSVSAAQAQSRGIPLLIPDWGGFSDISGQNVRHFSAKNICDSHKSLSVISDYAKIFSMSVISGNALYEKPIKNSRDYHPAKKINCNYLDLIMKKNEKRWGKEINLIRDVDLASFVKTNVGQEVFAQMRNIFLQI